MKTKQQILESFCSGRDFARPLESRPDSRPDLAKPWQHNGHAYASNRHWMVRMTTESLPEYEQHTWKAESISAWFANAPFHAATPMPTIDCPACKHCNGSGYQTAADCGNCRGSGCGVCNWEGEIYSPALRGAAEAVPCVCDGLGLQFSDDLIAPYMGGHFQTAYLSAISRLPGAAFAAAPESMRDKFPMAAFVFDGGQGLLMPCRDRKESA